MTDRDDDRDRPRHHDLDHVPTAGSGNALWEWTRHRHPLRVTLNYAVIWICRLSPSLRLKNWLYRRLGMEVGPRVAWGLEATPDVFWPNLITIEADAIVGYDATLLCHEFLRDELRVGPIHIEEGAMIGAGSVVLPGVRIGAGARVAANSLVDRDVPEGATVAGVPARETD